MRQHARLQSAAMRATSSGPLSRRMSGWRRMVPVAVQGASSSTTSKVRPGDQLDASASTTSASSRRRPRFARRRSSRCGRHIDRGHLRSGGGEHRRLAAGRRAKVGDGLAPDVARQSRHQRGGRVLHPPRAVGEARQVLDAPVRGEPDRAGGEELSAEPRGPGRRVGVGLDARCRAAPRAVRPRRCGAPSRRHRWLSSAATASRGC